MARGWESKAVEGQVQERESKEDRKNKKQVSQDEVEVRVAIDLQAAQAPRYRDQLTRALADIDAQLAKLPEEKK
jgi:hypothetical protein